MQSELRNRNRNIRNFLIQHATEAVQILQEFMPGATDDEKRAWCAQAVLSVLETLDDRIPVLGEIADSQAVDALEREAVEEIVDSLWRKSKRR